MVKIIANNYKVMCVKETLVNYLEHNKGKISTTKATHRITKGYEKLSNYCEKYYNKLSKKEIKDVKFRFSRILCLQYIGLKSYENAIRELLSMIKNKPFEIRNFKMFLRIINKRI